MTLFKKQHAEHAFTTSSIGGTVQNSNIYAKNEIIHDENFLIQLAQEAIVIANQLETLGKWN